MYQFAILWQHCSTTVVEAKGDLVVWGRILLGSKAASWLQGLVISMPALSQAKLKNRLSSRQKDYFIQGLVCVLSRSVATDWLQRLLVNAPFLPPLI